MTSRDATDRTETVSATRRTFDPACKELAEKFLVDSFDPTRARNAEEAEIVNKLAQTIQDAIENFLHYEMP